MAEERILEIDWPKLGIKVEANGLSYNQKFCDAFCQHLPFTTISQHTLVTGEALTFYVPWCGLEAVPLAERRFRWNELPVGNVIWGPLLGGMAIKYGPCTEVLWTMPIFRVPEQYLDDLKKAGRAIWEATFNTKELIEVEYRLKGRF